MGSHGFQWDPMGSHGAPWESFISHHPPHVLSHPPHQAPPSPPILVVSSTSSVEDEFAITCCVHHDRRHYPIIIITCPSSLSSYSLPRPHSRPPPTTLLQFPRPPRTFPHLHFSPLASPLTPYLHSVYVFSTPVLGQKHIAENNTHDTIYTIQKMETKEKSGLQTGPTTRTQIEVPPRPPNPIL